MDSHTWAKTALRRAIARCIRSQIEKLEREARVALRTHVMSEEGRELQSMARALRKQARATGWMA